MCLSPKLTYLIVYIAVKLSAVYSSIQFDEVEFYDPNKTLDESTSNGFLCAHLGEECQITAQCCGVGTCALPSWSDTPVCLVPGYKHDERFRKRFFSLHNLQPADIQYIRDSYNTSQYDFLLTDLTFSAPPLEITNTSLETIAANYTADNDSAISLSEDFRVDSVEPTLGVEVENSSQTKNVSFEENYDQNSTSFNDTYLKTYFNNSTGRVSSQTLLDYSVLRNKTFSSTGNSTNQSPGDSYFKTHFMFLLTNNTLGSSDSKLDVKEFYDQITTTDRFKNVVEQLRAKLQEISELENNLNTHTENRSTWVYKNREINQTTTERITTTGTEKLSKWNAVRKFFFHSQERPTINKRFNLRNSSLKEIVEDVIAKDRVMNPESTNVENIPLIDNPDDLTDNDKFKKIFEDVDKIEDIIDSDKRVNLFHKSKTENSGGLFDFYNIDVPLSSFNIDSERSDKSNNSLENVFRDIGDTINSMINSDNENKPLQEELDIKIKPDDEENNLSTHYNITFNKTRIAKEGTALNKTHFWDKINFWKVPKNLSEEVENSLKRLFFPKKESSSIKSKNKTIPLNEFFLLNLNSKTKQETVTPSQTIKTEKRSDYLIDLSSHESESSGTEELYNNSYVYMVHKEHLDEPVKLSSWNKVMNFFHRDRESPLTLDMDIQDIPEDIFNVGNNFSKMESENDPSIVDTPKIIRLPENLMPQVLDQRQTNDTDWFFEDSVEYDDRIVRHKSNRSFFFFF